MLCFWKLSIVLSLSKNTALFNFQNNVSEAGFCPRIKVKHTQLGPACIELVSPHHLTTVIRSKILLPATSQQDHYWRRAHDHIFVPFEDFAFCFHLRWTSLTT
jgi:hypothetical protein